MCTSTDRETKWTISATSEEPTVLWSALRYDNSRWNKQCVPQVRVQAAVGELVNPQVIIHYVGDDNAFVKITFQPSNSTGIQYAVPAWSGTNVIGWQPPRVLTHCCAVANGPGTAKTCQLSLTYSTLQLTTSSTASKPTPTTSYSLPEWPDWQTSFESVHTTRHFLKCLNDADFTIHMFYSHLMSPLTEFLYWHCMLVTSVNYLCSYTKVAAAEPLVHP